MDCYDSKSLAKGLREKKIPLAITMASQGKYDIEIGIGTLAIEFLTSRF